MCPGAADAGAGGPIRVLLVEDDPGDALLTSELLQGSGFSFKVEPVRQLADALAHLERGVECVLLDLGLPDAGGLEALDRILAAAPRTAVIVLTGRADRDLALVAVARGAQDYLQKGELDRELLSRSVRYAVERKRSEEAARQLLARELMASESARLERGLLARPMLARSGLRSVARYRSAGGSLLLGGDFYDAIELPDGSVRLVIGDVSGHGPDEAAIGVALRIAWRGFVLGGVGPEAVLPNLQALLDAERHNEDLFATVCDATIAPDRRSVALRLAGHPGPILMGEETRQLTASPGSRSAFSSRHGGRPRSSPSPRNGRSSSTPTGSWRGGPGTTARSAWAPAASYPSCGAAGGRATTWGSWRTGSRRGRRTKRWGAGGRHCPLPRGGSRVSDVKQPGDEAGRAFRPAPHPAAGPELLGAGHVTALALGTAAWAYVREVDARNHLVDVVDPARLDAQSLLSDYVDEETGVRGYVLSHQESFLQPYTAGVASARDDLSQLGALVVRDRQSSGLLVPVERAMATWRAQFALPAITVTRSGERRYASTAEQDLGKADFDGVRGAFTALDRALRSSALSSTSTLEESEDTFLALGLAVVALLVVAGASAIWALRSWVIRPLAGLRDDVREVAGGELDHPVRVGWPPGPGGTGAGRRFDASKDRLGGPPAGGGVRRSQGPQRRPQPFQPRTGAVRLRRLARPPGAPTKGRQLLRAAQPALRLRTGRARPAVHRLRRRRGHPHAGAHK